MVVKSKRKELGIFDFFKSLYNMRIFASKFGNSNIIIYCLILLGIFAIVNIVIALNAYASVVNQILLGVIGVPIVLFIVYFPFYFFLVAFNGKSYHFWEGYLVFFVVSMHFIILGNFITSYIMEMVYSTAILGFLRILMLALGVYYIINLVINLKNYYKTMWQRVLASLILVKLIFMVIIVTLYFNYILLSMGL